MADRPRVLLLNPYAGPGYSGPAVFADRLFRGMSLRDANVTLVSRHSSGSPWASDRVRVRFATTLGSIGQIAWAVQASIAIWRLRDRVDLVHLHGAYLFGLVPALAARALGIPYVILPLLAGGDLSVNSHTSRLPVANVLRRHVVSNAMVGFALAPEISSEFVHWGLAEDRIVLLGNVVDVHAFRPPVPDHRREKFVLGFVGRVGERKGSLVVLGSLAELRARDYPEARALFVGPFQSDEFRLRFWSRARELDVQDSVEVTGYLEDVGDLVCGEMSVFALPSRAEGLPGALCEAMAAGVPVVVTGLSSMLRIVEESGAGLVVGHDDPSSLADAVAALWADPAVWSRTSRQARSYAESKFAIDVNVSRYVEYALKGSQRTHDK